MHMLLIVLLFCYYLCTESEVTLVRMERYGSRHPIEEPRDDVEGCWPQRQLVAVMAHEPNHWVSYRKTNNEWWLLDSATPNIIVRRNPFNEQYHHTIDLLIFK